MSGGRGKLSRPLQTLGGADLYFDIGPDIYQEQDSYYQVNISFRSARAPHVDAESAQIRKDNMETFQRKYGAIDGDRSRENNSPPRRGNAQRLQGYLRTYFQCLFQRDPTNANKNTTRTAKVQDTPRTHVSMSSHGSSSSGSSIASS